MKPIIGITMGDPAGIGPEVTVKSLVACGDSLPFHPLIIGKYDVFRQVGVDSSSAVTLQRFQSSEVVEFRQGTLAVLDICNSPLTFSPGSSNASCGEHSFQAVAEGVRLCRSGQIQAIVTSPICKQSWHLAGHFFDGHTGLLAHLTDTRDYRMMFAAEPFHVVLTTTHLPLKEVSAELTIRSVCKTIELGWAELKKLGIRKPKIAVCGLNPHAGENGIFGDEELKTIVPAIRQAQKKGIEASGPFSADTVFLSALNGEFDLIVAQYHDQGLIPVKLLAFETAVNVTIGLPIIRTSVDHGTAFDIAGQGTANYRNMSCAINYAYRLCNEGQDNPLEQ